MPEIIKDKKFEDFLIGLIMDNYQQRETREGHKWHVSDLLFARYAVLQRLCPKKPTRDDIGFFLTGEAYHEFMQRLLGEKDSEVKGELLNVLGTADYFNGETLLEIKTSRKWTVPDLPQDHYIEQAGYYCAIFGKSSARIAVIYPVAGRKWDGTTASTIEIVAWEVSFSDVELKAIKSKMKDLTFTLDAALVSKTINSLPYCIEWKCGSVERNTEEKTYEVKLRCPYAVEKLCAGNPALQQSCAEKMEKRRVFKK